VTEAELVEFVKTRLSIKVVDDGPTWKLPDTPSVRVQLLFDGVVISEDAADLPHTHE